MTRIPRSIRFLEQDIELIETLADDQGSNFSALTSHFVHRFLNNYLLSDINREISFPRPFARELFDCIDPTKIKNLVEVGETQLQSFLDMKFNGLTENNIGEAIKWWFDQNHFRPNLVGDSKTQEFRLNHNMGEIWAKINTDIIKNILNNNNCKVLSKTSSRNAIRIKYSKEK